MKTFELSLLLAVAGAVGTVEVKHARVGHHIDSKKKHHHAGVRFVDEDAGSEANLMVDVDAHLNAQGVFQMMAQRM